MSVKVMGLVYDSDIGPAPVRSVLLGLADNANHGGYCKPGARHLAGKTLLSRSTVFRALKALEEDGIIQRVERFRPNGSRQSNAYRINLELLAARRRPIDREEEDELADLFSAADDPFDDPGPAGDETPGQPPVSERHGGPTSGNAGQSHTDTTPVDNSGSRETPRVSLTPPPCHTDTPARVRATPLEPSVEPSDEPRGVESQRKVTTRTHAREQTTTPQRRREPAPPATGHAAGSDDYRARTCRMCRLDTDGRTWIRVLPVDGRPPYTPLTVCDHETPLDAIQREQAFLEQHAEQEARAAAPAPITLAGPLNRGPRPAIRRTTRGTDADRERARVELAEARARMGEGPDPMETRQAMEASG